MNVSPRSFESLSAHETKEAGRRLGKILAPGDFISLAGELGAGKTTFVQGVAEGAEVSELATSPSFALVNEYHGRITLYHIDLYRLSGPEDMDGIGFGEYPGAGAALVEWAERAGGELPDERLEVLFEHTGIERRRITLTATGERYVKLMDSICPPSR